MKYLWIGVGNSQEGRAHIIENGGELFSDEVSNDALLSGLDACGIHADTINSSRVPPYPIFKKKRISSFKWIYPSGATGVSVGYLNYKYVNRLFKKRSVVKEAKAWARANKGEDVTVFVYQMHTPFMAAATAVKRIIPNAKIVLIVADLPQYMDMNMSSLKKLLKRIDWSSIKKNMRYVDKYVLYSEAMASFLKLKDGSYITMEGSYDISTAYDGEISKDTEKISIMYSGALTKKYGIVELLDAMKELDDNYELWLTGGGDAVSLVEEKAKEDTRIKYFGYIPSRIELLKKQKEATMLINIRDPKEPASKYCFPSKIFEYMVSGNPVLSTVIEGIPREYFDYIIPLPDIDSATLCKKIRDVAKMSAEERASYGEKARDYVLKRKNNVAQMKAVLDFISE